MAFTAGAHPVWWGRGRAKTEDDLAAKTIWALKDVSFEIRQGDVVGIVGRNGSGKSTLLKLISRITWPTEGHVEFRGRVGSLLEVGTGFHQELTGRENVYLSGAILGMTRAEIRSKFDEIVAFSEIEKFLDTPVKHYSSGMYVRLAFSVAASLETEILLVDEVLAVGDVQFQKKCLERIGQISQGGRTVLIVSHNMDAVQTMCRNVLVLDNGQVTFSGECREGVRKYFDEHVGRRDPTVSLAGYAARDGTQEIRVSRLSVFHPERGPTNTFFFGEPIGFEIEVEDSGDFGAMFEVRVRTIEGVTVADFVSINGGLDLVKVNAGDRVRAIVPENRFCPGTYICSVKIGDAKSHRIDFVYDCLNFEVLEGANSGMKRPLSLNLSAVYQPSRWELIRAGK